jgi:glucose-6-phosphate isomerase
MRLHPGILSEVVESRRPRAQSAATGLFKRDPATWSPDPDVQKRIANRLGWLTSPQLMADSVRRLTQFASGVKHDGITDVVLLGMGGSSLAPEVLRAIVGIAPGYPRLHMLDSTDPSAVRAAATRPDRTLYLLASKSGTTIEPNVLAAHFKQRLLDAGVAGWAAHFVAITDEGTDLHRRAQTERFRDVFVNPSDIGGRYSALSFFGMVPSALMGQDVGALVSRGLAMLSTPTPGVELGLAIGAAAGAGRDKMTLLVPESLEPFGLWVEQLIAESTGKSGVGVVPIAGEPAGPPSVYGPDRFFVRLGPNPSALDEATVAGAPHTDIEFPEPVALGAEFVRWEIATAVAGAILGINPFDEPNVQQAKDATRTLLASYTKDGRLPTTSPDRTLAGGTTIALSGAARLDLGTRDATALLTLLRPRDYFSLLAYLGPDDGLARELRALRQAVRDRAKVATMLGYGPRYLHSTGQLHKGGPNSGVFLLITTGSREDLAIPGEPFSFETLEHAQALGDFQSLDVTGRRALHAHLPSADPALLKALADHLLAPLA